MTTKSMTTAEGITLTLNVDQVVYSRPDAVSGHYFCRLSSGDNITFTSDPLATT